MDLLIRKHATMPMKSLALSNSLGIPMASRVLSPLFQILIGISDGQALGNPYGGPSSYCKLYKGRNSKGFGLHGVLMVKSLEIPIRPPPIM